MTQNELRIHDVESQKDILSFSLDSGTVIPRVDEILVLHKGTDDPVQYKVISLKHEYQILPPDSVKTSVILDVKRKGELQYGLVAYQEEQEAKGH